MEREGGAERRKAWLWRLTIASLVAIAALSQACGGGGGSGGGATSNPVAPPAPPPTAPPQPGLTNQTLYGQVIGMFDPSSNFAGSRVQVSGVIAETVASDNSFRLEPIQPGDYVLVVVGQGHLKRHVRVRMKAGGPNEIPALDLAEDLTFNLQAFDEIYREESERGTARFVEQPKFLIDREDFDALPGTRGDFLVARINEAIKGPIKMAIRPFFSGVQVVERASIRNYANPCELPEGEINWQAERNLQNDMGEPLLGQAWWCWFPDAHIVRGGILSLDDEAEMSTILHEIVHIIGGADHLEKAPGASIIEPGTSRRVGALTSMDEQHLQFLYSRPPRLMSPDDARGLPPADLTEVSGGSGQQVRCNIYKDGRVEIEYFGARGLFR